MTVAERGVQSRLVREPAGFGSRLAAYLLDWLVAFILACLSTAAAGLLLLLTSDMGRQDPPDRAIYAALIVASLAPPVWLVITLLGWTWSGRTVGKLAVNLRIVNGRGATPSIWRALLRLAVYMIESAPLAAVAPVAVVALLLRSQPFIAPMLVVTGAAVVIPLTSALLVIRDARRRALHDRIAGTYVVRE